MVRPERSILTTHTGSLPRPGDLMKMLSLADHGASVPELEQRVAEHVRSVVEQQLSAGLAIVNDGEAGRMSYATYVTGRLEGFGDASDGARSFRGMSEFPDYFARLPQPDLVRPVCIGPVSHRDSGPMHRDVANLRSAMAETHAEQAFMTAASPGIIARYMQNRHYPSHEDYIWALADAMKPEYDAVHAAGFLLQLDCPDLTGTDSPKQLATHIDAVNYATRDIPPERMRLHVCWGNYEGPHNHDVPLAEILNEVLRARPAGLLVEAANPRHAHEWRIFEDVALPDGKVLIPGMIDSTTNYIEHPELIAERLVRYARLVGPDNIIAGTDCGFATTATDGRVDAAIAWAKLRALAEGAGVASRQLST